MYTHDDVRTLTAGRLREAGALPDIIVGSPPCPAYSAANRHGAHGGLDDDPLFLELVRLVGECRPVWCVAENSPRLRLLGADRIIAELEALGYACWSAVVGAEHAGKNHIRRRSWLIAADAERLQLWHEPGRSSRANGQGAPEPGDSLAAGDAGYTGSSGLAIATGERGDPCQEREAIERATWPDTAAGFSPPPLLDDGPPLDLALYRAVCAAQGDAIVPQVALPILRAMRNAFPDARRVLDLFGGGVGGWHYACAWAGLEVVAACEIDPWRREVYRAVHVGVGRRSERSAAQ